MPFRYIFILLAMGVGAQVSASTGTTEFSYRVEVPSITGQSCEIQGKTMAKTLGQEPGLKVTKVRCHQGAPLVDLGQTYSRDIIKIYYQAKSELIPVRARFSARETLGTILDGSGIFPKYSDCLEAISPQSKIFERETRIKTLAGYCQLSSDAFYPGYSLTLEGFGHPARKLFLFSNTDMVNPSSKAIMTITEAAREAILAAGAHIILNDENRIFYYNNRIVDISISNLGSFPEASQCESQQAEAQSIYAKGRLINATALCLNNNNLMVVAAGLNMVSEDYGGQSPRYSTFSDCMEDRERMIQNVSGRGLTLYGAICQPSRFYEGEYAVTLFYSPDYR